MISIIRNHLGEKIDYEYLGGGESFADWVVVLGHGVTGNRDRPVIAETALALNQAGFSTLAFSFSGNGGSEGDFRDSCVSKGVRDLESVINATEHSKVAYVGHSMGAAIGVLAAGKKSKIHCLVSIAGMVDTRKFANTEFGEETPDEGCMWEDEDCPLSQAFMDDLCDTVGSVLVQTDEVRVPWLLLHGTADDVVLPEDSVSVKDRLGDRVDHEIIEGADHSFNEEHRQAQVELVVSWLVAACSN